MTDLKFPKDDPWTKDDWLDFCITLLKFKDRFIERHYNIAMFNPKEDRPKETKDNWNNP